MTDQLRAMPRPSDAPVRWVPEADWHVTLRFVGEADPHEVAERLDHARIPSAMARLGPGVTLLGPSAVIIPCSGLDRLAAAIREATEGIGEVDPRPFVGHLTVARVVGPDPWTPPSTAISVEFEVPRLALVASTLTGDGPRYEPVGEWPPAD
ncbi:MAG: hypothetical protein GY929_26860 [Actinomycetia bacterium]|nr:hypothetical protein [Actinomycetes bacterium]